MSIPIVNQILNGQARREVLPTFRSSTRSRGVVVKGETLQTIGDVHKVTIFKVLDGWSWSFLIPWRCRWSHNLILSDMEVSKLVREELWEQWTYPVIGIVPIES